MTEEEYQALLTIGYVGIPHTTIADVCDPLPTREQQEAAFASLLNEYGLDITQPMRLTSYFDAQIYLFKQDPQGRVINLESLHEF
jgi:hypothetical protein